MRIEGTTLMFPQNWFTCGLTRHPWYFLLSRLLLLLLGWTYSHICLSRSVLIYCEVSAEFDWELASVRLLRYKYPHCASRHVLCGGYGLVYISSQARHRLGKLDQEGVGGVEDVGSPSVEADRKIVEVDEISWNMEMDSTPSEAISKEEDVSEAERFLVFPLLTPATPIFNISV